ncbi:MAG: response regulator [Thermoanaerobaculia bacterium]
MRGMKTVLVVDDEPSVLFALSEGLTDRRRGIRVETAANGVEAVAVLESGRVDLVLTDLRMPDMDGFELLAYLRRNFTGLPVILMTALGSTETSARLGSTASFEVLAKPFTVAALKQKIAEMLAQRVKGRVENISLSSFLQLLEMERKTCTLSIRSLDREGRLFFRAGRLVGADLAGQEGQPAALEIVTWEHAEIEIADGCPRFEPEVEATLSFLLMEGMRLKDELEAAGEAEPERAGEDPEAALDRLASGPSRVPDELGALLADALARGKALKSAAILLFDAGGGVVASAGGAYGVETGAALAPSAARFLREAAGNPIQEMLVTSDDHYLLARPAGRDFLLLVLDRHRSNLARAQLDLVAVERALAERS